METALWIAAVVAVLAGFAGVVLPLLPGTPLLSAGLWLAAWLEGYAKVGVAMVVVLGVMALAGFIVDYVASALSVRRARASGMAMAGAGLGALLGIFAGLPGLILGPVVGAVIGEWIARRHTGHAVRAGMAAGIGFVVAMAAKLGIAVGMISAFAFAYFI